MKKLNLVIYGVFGTIAIAIAILLLFSPRTPAGAVQADEIRHLLREQGAAAVFIGLMAFWCIFNYERRKPIHYAFIVFTSLIAAIHWVDFLADRRHWLSVVVNTTPLAILLLMMLWSRPAEVRDT